MTLFYSRIAQGIFLRTCVKALPQGADSRVGGTQNKGKSLRPFKAPLKAPALAAG